MSKEDDQLEGCVFGILNFIFGKKVPTGAEKEKAFNRERESDFRRLKEAAFNRQKKADYNRQAERRDVFYDSPVFPYLRQRYFLTECERNFYRVLRFIVRGKYEIFSNVALKDVFEVKKGFSRSDWQGLYNKIDRKHVDFILCDWDTLQIKLAIELDDYSHDRLAARKNDDFKNEIFKYSKVPLVRIRASYRYCPEELVQILNNASRKTS